MNSVKCQKQSYQKKKRPTKLCKNLNSVKCQKQSSQNRKRPTKLCKNLNSVKCQKQSSQNRKQPTKLCKNLNSVKCLVVNSFEYLPQMVVALKRNVSLFLPIHKVTVLACTTCCRIETLT